MKQIVIFCIEHMEDDVEMDIGKHHYIFDEEFGHYCKYCFLPKSKANYRPIIKNADGKFVYKEEL